MSRQAPPLGAIEAFIVTAHSRTFREGAAKLALSPSALSRRIATLEGVLGTPLFDRSAMQIKLTAAGEAYRSEIEIAVTRFAGETNKSVVPSRPSLICAKRRILPIAIFRRARLKGGVAGICIRTQDDVDHARDRIRSILSSRSIAQNLHALDRSQR